MPKEETALQRCVNSELDRYFEMLDGEVPHDLHRMVMKQVESALISYVLAECRGNQSKAAQWLGISRGTLRGKIADSQSNDKLSGLAPGHTGHLQSLKPSTEQGPTENS